MGFVAEQMPIAPFSDAAADRARRLGDELSKLSVQARQTAQDVLEWLRHTRGIEKPSMSLRNSAALDADAFVSAVFEVLPKRQRPSAADIADLKREYATSIEPSRQARAKVFALERELSDLVNGAYGLTSEDVALMWRTAPPRMPFTPSGLQDVAPPAEDADGQEIE
ncbi:MAG: hypothetical protein GC154_21650 [bacterium]|nr:hypothetical protein [bacterium]